MKVKVDGMSEKPTNTDNSDHSEVLDECCTGEDCAGGLVLQDGDVFPRKRHSSDKRVSIALEEIEDIDSEVQTVSDADDVYVLAENTPKPPPRSDSHGDQPKNQSEADDITEPSGKPIPPPRSDSKGHKPKVRHMVDIFGRV
ncbi:uncharacterized protein LOC128556889 [Mercenaria mercenaria]|uniref:uncharacterized protein LOC128556889 n=1 Tax=Mercenaria mercenaria TaxID=6596 RepID=UPI00234EF970|nr:uncharacterized protein LOC128556889 [Mercenaria mercenaria]